LTIEICTAMQTIAEVFGCDSERRLHQSAESVAELSCQAQIHRVYSALSSAVGSIAEEATIRAGRVASSFGVMDTLLSTLKALKEDTSWSIASSWRLLLVDLLSHANRFTTETVSALTTGLRTWNSWTLRNTSANTMLPPETRQSGWKFVATAAVSSLASVLSKSLSQDPIFAPGPAPSLPKGLTPTEPAASAVQRSESTAPIMSPEESTAPLSATALPRRSRKCLFNALIAGQTFSSQGPSQEGFGTTTATGNTTSPTSEGSRPDFLPVIVAMKPLREKTYLDQALANGHGVTWQDGCRIPIASGETVEFTHPMNSGRKGGILGESVPNARDGKTFTTTARFPANLLVSDGALDNGRVTVSGVKECGKYAGTDRWVGPFQADGATCYGDAGSFSRFFSLDSWWAERLRTLPPEIQATFPFIIEPKPAKSEKDMGLDHLPERRKVFNGHAGDASAEMKDVEARFSTTMRNGHPTVKSIALMSWLITLGSRPGDVIIDPFCGSGSTLLAAEMLDRRWIGCEMEQASHDIARARIEYMRNHVRRVKGSRLPGMETAAPIEKPKGRRKHDPSPTLFPREEATPA